MPVLVAAADWSVQRMKEFTAQGLANMVWAVAHLDLQNEIQLLALADAVIDKASLLQTQNVANIAWAFGRLAVRNSRLLQALSTRLQNTAGFDPQNISNTFWAFATLLCHDAALMTKLAQEAHQQMDRFGGQDVSNVVWSFATLMLQDWPLVCALRVAALRNQPQMQPQHLSNTVWAYSTLQVPVLELCPACIVRLPEFDLQGLANVSWAVANSIYSDHPLLEATERLLCSSQILDMHCQITSADVYWEMSRFSNHICQLIWAFSFSGRLTPDLGERLKRTLLDIGLNLDRMELEPHSEREPKKATGAEISSSLKETGRPRILTKLQGISVIYKPPGWEVDAKGQSNLQSGLPLSAFVQEQEISRVVRLAAFEYGFIHRLDVPSSGLLLVGTNFLGLAMLQWQMHMYSISREYVVLTADCWPAVIGNVDVPVQDFLPGRSFVDANGRPADTRVKAIGHYETLLRRQTLVLLVYLSHWNSCRLCSI